MTSLQWFGLAAIVLFGVVGYLLFRVESWYRQQVKSLSQQVNQANLLLVKLLDANEADRARTLKPGTTWVPGPSEQQYLEKKLQSDAVQRRWNPKPLTRRGSVPLSDLL